jgi:ABC-2 type transport system ATP-binding protein
MESIHIANLCKSFGTKAVLNKVSFDVPPGKVLALLGRNGAGKTTLMRIMYGLIHPDHGESIVSGLSSQGDPVALRYQVGMMTEECHLYPWMTGTLLEHFLRPLYPSWNHDFYLQMVKLLEVPLETRIQDMSKGSKRKLMLAATLAPKPKVLLLDEPLAGLDAVVREQILSTIIHILAEEGVTILVSSHEILEIERICDFVAILSRGDLILHLDSEALKSRVRRVTATMETPLSLLPSHPDILFTKARGAELELILTNYSEESTAALLRNFKVREQRSEGLSLQDIFIRLTSGKEE